MSLSSGHKLFQLGIRAEKSGEIRNRYSVDSKFKFWILPANKLFHFQFFHPCKLFPTNKLSTFHFSTSSREKFEIFCARQKFFVEKVYSRTFTHAEKPCRQNSNYFLFCVNFFVFVSSKVSKSFQSFRSWPTHFFNRRINLKVWVWSLNHSRNFSVAKMKNGKWFAKNLFGTLQLSWSTRSFIRGTKFQPTKSFSHGIFCPLGSLQLTKTSHRTK